MVSLAELPVQAVASNGLPLFWESEKMLHMGL